MARTLSLELANFTLRFGEDHVLLDYLEEIVLPAFVEPRERLSYGSTLLFHKVKLVNAGRDGAEFPAIAGRIVKLTTIQRNQTYDRESRDLVAQPLSLESSPSSFFILILDGHKLLYIKEEKDSPTIGIFASTTEKFLTEA